MLIWCRDYRDEVYTDALMRDLDQFENVNLMFGQSVAKEFPKDATVIIRSRRAPTDFFKTGGFWMISKKLKGILDSFSVKAEYFPVSVVRAQGKPLAASYYCFNVLNEVDCLSRSGSSFTKKKNWATKITRVKINERKVGSGALLLMAKTIPELVAVREDLATAISEANCSGVTFKTPEEWRNNAYPGT